jgi:hypothetical protein
MTLRMVVIFKNEQQDRPVRHVERPHFFQQVHRQQQSGILPNSPDSFVDSESQFLAESCTVFIPLPVVEGGLVVETIHPGSVE